MHEWLPLCYGSSRLDRLVIACERNDYSGTSQPLKKGKSWLAENKQQKDIEEKLYIHCAETHTQSCTSRLHEASYNQR